MPNKEDFGRPEKPLEIKRKIDNEARISKKTKMKKRKSIQKSEADNSVRHPAKLSNILGSI